MVKNKPPALCNMVKDKAIGAQNNFADTFNWIVSVLDELLDYNVKIEEKEVVVDVSYNPASHQLVQKKETMKCLVVSDRSSPDGEEVFTATPLSSESLY